MKFTIDQKYIDEGLVTERAHNTEPYLIYNYTPTCQFSKAWDDVAMMCRGLIVHKDTREIIARPFPKFFNYAEHIEKGLPIPNENPEVTDKRDGSLGILYWGVDGTPYIATRGSFHSEQAEWATEWFRVSGHGDFINWDKTATHLFEIIYPENRIVVDYGGYRGLDLLAVIDTETGKDLPVLRMNIPLGMPVQPIPFTSFEELKAREVPNHEGFTLFFPKAGLRLKIKFDEYVRLHRIITGLSELGIWEMLRDGKTKLEIIADIPDEMFEWAEGVIDNLIDKYKFRENSGIMILAKVRGMQSRKDQAEVIKNSPFPSIAFAMLDEKDYSQIIWKMIRPHGSYTFRKDIDA